jgi:ribonuclease HII
VVAAAVILDGGRRVRGLADSKLLTAERREELFAVIYERAIAVGIGIIDHVTIDRVNILQATKRAMAEAIRSLAVEPELVITDFVSVPALTCPQRNIVDGDARCATVAAASIVAKVTRDRLMVKLSRRYRRYAWDSNKGYGTPEHAAAIKKHGVCTHHRRSFSPIERALRLLETGQLPPLPGELSEGI